MDLGPWASRAGDGEDAVVFVELVECYPEVFVVGRGLFIEVTVMYWIALSG